MPGQSRFRGKIRQRPSDSYVNGKFITKPVPTTLPNGKPWGLILNESIFGKPNLDTRVPFDWDSFKLNLGKAARKAVGLFDPKLLILGLGEAIGSAYKEREYDGHGVDKKTGQFTGDGGQIGPDGKIYYPTLPTTGVETERGPSGYTKEELDNFDTRYSIWKARGNEFANWQLAEYTEMIRDPLKYLKENQLSPEEKKALQGYLVKMRIDGSTGFRTSYPGKGGIEDIPGRWGEYRYDPSEVKIVRMRDGTEKAIYHDKDGNVKIVDAKAYFASQGVKSSSMTTAKRRYTTIRTGYKNKPLRY